MGYPYLQPFIVFRHSARPPLALLKARKTETIRTPWDSGHPVNSSMPAFEDLSDLAGHVGYLELTVRVFVEIPRDVRCCPRYKNPDLGHPLSCAELRFVGPGHLPDQIAEGTNRYYGDPDSVSQRQNGHRRHIEIQCVFSFARTRLVSRSALD